jgi:rubrerythrin
MDGAKGEEPMSTVQAVKRADPRGLLRSLAELDYDALQAYETAAERAEGADIKKRLGEFCEDHRRHVNDINLLLVDLKGKPLLEDDFKHILLEGKVFIASLVGDRALLKAMQSNEEETTKTYKNAVEMRGFAPEVTKVIENNYADERRHLAWIRGKLEAMSDPLRDDSGEEDTEGMITEPRPADDS